jgi:hypothetical protein
MNFQSVNQANGQYIKMMAQIINAGYVNQGKYGQEASILVQDTSGIQGTIICSPGKYNAPIPTAQNHGQTQEFSVKAAQTNAGLKFYGFWNVPKQAPQKQCQTHKPPYTVAQQAQQNTPNMPQLPAQATNAIQTAQNPSDSELRRFCIEQAIKVLCAGKLKSDSSIYDEANAIMRYVKTESATESFDEFAANNPVGQDNIPNY